MACWQDILAIPAKKQARPAVSHLTVEQARRLLAQPDRSTRQAGHQYHHRGRPGARHEPRPAGRSGLLWWCTSP